MIRLRRVLLSAARYRVAFILAALSFMAVGIGAPVHAQSAEPVDGKALIPGSPTSDVPLSKGAAPTECVDGFAGVHACANVRMRSHLSVVDLGLPETFRLNDLWGWEHAASGRAFALVGSVGSTVFVDVTDPDSPFVVGELPRTPGSSPTSWRDIKVNNDHAYIVQDGSTAAGHGMQVFDLNQLLQVPSGTRAMFTASALYSNVGSSHNVVINEETDLAIIVGSGRGAQTCGGGLHMVDISDPLNPVFAGCFSDSLSRRGYSHDAQCVVYQGPDVAWTGREICVGYNEDAIVISDITDRANPVAVSSASYPQSAYIHQGWFTEDHRYLVQDDELDERGFGHNTLTRIWDVEDLDDPVLLSTFESPVGSVDHNLYIKDDFVFQANYTSGLRILDISDPAHPVLGGYFDTYFQDDDADFDGAWSAYPYLSSGVLLVSDRDNGLFVLEAMDLGLTNISDVVVEGNSDRATVSWTVTSVRGTATMAVEMATLATGADDFDRVESIDITEPGAYRISQFNLEPGAYRLRLVLREAGTPDQVQVDEVVFILPEPIAVQGPWPNPASASARVLLSAREAQQVHADLFDARGRLVKRVFEGSMAASSVQIADIDLMDLPAGVYYLHVVSDRNTLTRELIRVP